MNNIQKLRYLFVSRTLRGGGAERFVSTFTSYLADLEYDVHILLYETSDSDYSLSDKVKIHKLPYEPISLKGKLLRIIDMKKAMEKINPDIIIPFVDTVVSCSFIANLRLEKKFIYTVRVSPWHEELQGSKFSNFVRKIIAYKANAIMLQTNEQGEFFPAAYSSKQYTVPNPIPEKYKVKEKIYYRSNYKKIVMIGRLEKQKNIPLLIRAFAMVLKSNNTELELYIYGEGTERDNLQALINKLRLQNKCHLMGRNNDVDNVLMSADMYVLSSDFEGMPNSLMEAMAIGVPCVSSNCKTGPKDLIVDEETGLLFEVGNKEELVNKIEWAITHTEEMNKIGKQARKEILKKYDINNSKKCFDSMIRKIDSTKYM